MPPKFVTRKESAILTRDQKMLLLTLVRRDARDIGYGTKYTSPDESNWPQRLKTLRTIARKLMTEDPL